MYLKIFWVLILLFCAVFSGSPLCAQETSPVLSPDQWKTFNDFVDQARGKCKIPGAAVAVVQDGKIVDEKGFGVCEKGKDAKVTPQTLFMIGGGTKPLSTLLMARLVDEGKFSWDSPVAKVMPGFHFGDAQTTRELTMKDTVCACAGFPRGELELFFGPADGDSWKMMKEMEAWVPSASPGETFHINDQLAAAGGYFAAHALYPGMPFGEAYNQAMKTQVFGPLGMKGSTADLTQAVQGEHASPHGRDLDLECDLLPLTIENWTVAVSPALGVWSNADDMAKYLLMELSNGEAEDGSVYVSKKNLLERREPRVKASNGFSYGLGFYLEDENGKSRIGLNGGVTGFDSATYFYPDQGVGLVVLANADSSRIFLDAVKRRLAEILFGLDPKAQKYLDENWEKKEFEHAASTETDLLRQRFGYMYENKHFFSPIEGTYVNEDLGKISIRVQNEYAFLSTTGWTSQIASFTANDGSHWIIIAGAPLTGTWLKMDKKGGLWTLTLKTKRRDYVFENVSAGQGDP